MHGILNATLPLSTHRSSRAASGAEMSRVLGAFDLVALGVGCIIGAGIVVLTGVAAHDHAGPAVVLSYVVGGVAAMITGRCHEQPLPCHGTA